MLPQGVQPARIADHVLVVVTLAETPAERRPVVLSSLWMYSFVVIVLNHCTMSAKVARALPPGSCSGRSGVSTPPCVPQSVMAVPEALSDLHTPEGIAVYFFR